MLILEGMGTSRGIADGKILIIESENNPPKILDAVNCEEELQKFYTAKELAKSQLMALCQKASQEVGDETATIFEIHTMMLNDTDFQEAVKARIREHHNSAEYAVYLVGREFARNFSQMNDSYMKERAADVIDISHRMIHILTGSSEKPLENMPGKVVIAAEDLMPSQTVRLDKKKIVAFITRNGSQASHSSILARSLGIPSVAALGTGFTKLNNGDYVIVDGSDGTVIIDPDVITNAQYTVKKHSMTEHEEKLKALKGTPAQTKDGYKIELYANIGHPDDILSVLENDAEGIGLFRSEFLFLGRNDFPSEEVQCEAYASVLEKMGEKRVVVRTLDLGADKQASYLNIPCEDNPAMGYRAIRMQLDRVDLFITQLRALYRASVHGRLAIMFPMITSVNEVQLIKKLCEEVKKNLTQEGIPFSGCVELGIMMETPAAALTADRLAAEVDFFSIGTNDLTQYTLAADRMNSKVAYLYDCGHPAVLRMIRYITEQAHRHGIWVGICGESASDLNLTQYYLRFGVDELSVSPPAVLELKEKIQSLELATLMESIDNTLD